MTAASWSSPSSSMLSRGGCRRPGVRTAVVIPGFEGGAETGERERGTEGGREGINEKEQLCFDRTFTPQKKKKEKSIPVTPCRVVERARPKHA